MNKSGQEEDKSPVGSVMVVGGGISGIQAALDLATTGFRVYLVEKSPAIGGHMAQLDKTFPTNDCAMCTISPKLVETGRHLNIDVMVDTEVQAVDGTAGDFKVTVRHNPRYIDLEKCVGCGTCNIVCPTCYCFNVEEEVDISVTKGSRERHWDGCMLRKFSEVAGGEVFRESLASRQRHRVFRKFKYISDQTGQPWCIGCGRCTAYCTADISIVGIVNRLIGDHERVTVAPV